VILNDVEPQLTTLIRSQTRIGWTHLYNGRLTKHWAQAIDMLHPKLPLTGEQIMTTLLKAIWAYILDTWTLRNSHLHTTAAQLDLPNY